MVAPGTLYLLPTPIIDDGWATLPPGVFALAARLNVWIAESDKPVFRLVKQARRAHDLPIPPDLRDELSLYVIEPLADGADVRRALRPLSEGRDVGLISDAGCPAIADPGAMFVRAAYEMGARVAPIAGPSALMLAVMASGFCVSRFCFHGYLNRKEGERRAALRKLEETARRERSAHYFIETPYRNATMLDDMLGVLADDTLIHVSADLTGADEYCLTAPVAKLRKTTRPDLHKRPALFGLSAL